MAFAQFVLTADPSADFLNPALPDAQQQQLPPSLCQAIMVRECYRAIVELIMDADEEHAATGSKDGFAFVLTGTPGIGKSALALYLICCLAQQRQRILYRCVHMCVRARVACSALVCAQQLLHFHPTFTAVSHDKNCAALKYVAYSCSAAVRVRILHVALVVTLAQHVTNISSATPACACRICHDRYIDNVTKETVLLLDFTDPNNVKVDKASEVSGDLNRLTGACMLGHAPCISAQL